MSGKVMPFHPLSQNQEPLVRAWCEVAPGRSALPRQTMGGQDLGSWFQRDGRTGQSSVFLYTGKDGELQGAMLLFQPFGEGREAQVSWVEAVWNTPHALSQMMPDGLELAFSTLGLRRLTWDLVDPDERLAGRYRKLGFVVEGRFREQFHDGHSHRDVTRLALLRADWLAARSAVEAQMDVHAQPTDVAQTYSIQILTDAGSWIAPYVDELAIDWAAAGHTVRVAHGIEQALPADFCFCLSFSRIVSAAVRSLYKHTLVVHESDLPKGRGWAPMSWQILEGKSRIPVTLIEAVDAVDAGPIYLQEQIELTGTELNPEWRALQARATLKLCREWVQAYPSIRERARPQEGAGSVYARRRPEDSRLDPRKTVAEQFNLLRVVDNENYPAFFDMNGRRYSVRIVPQD
jgi:methionyl-tRNA formyltransferase